MLKAKLQKTILGKEIKSFQFYKMTLPLTRKEKTFGYVWLVDGNRIRIEGSKFFIERNGARGFIEKTENAYKQIKRMIANWFRPYKNHRIFKYGDGYLTRKYPNRQFLLTAKA